MNGLTEEQVRNIIREEIQRVIGSAQATPIEMLQLIDVGAEKAGYTKTASSVKTVASATQAVNEGGLATYNVAKIPDGFFLVEGTNYNVPYFTS